MRIFACGLALVFCVACGQKEEHPALAPSCDPAVMTCRTTLPGSSSGTESNSGGASGDEGVAKLSGRVIEFSDDYFDQGPVFAGTATVSATGESGARVSASYDGKTFELDGALKTAVNWFLVEPEGTGALPTLAAVDTRSVSSDALIVAVAPADAVDQIFLNSGTDRALERAQLVVHVIDGQRRSVPGIQGTLSATAELTQYRMASVWVRDDASGGATDDTGLLFFGNVQAGSTLTKATVSLSGTTTSRLEVELKAGAITVVNAIVSGK